MRKFKDILKISMIMLVLFLIFIIVIYFLKFNKGFSDNPDHFYSVLSIIISTLTLLVTTIIAVFLYELTLKTSKLSDQREIYQEINRIITENRIYLIDSNQTYNEFSGNIYSFIKKLDELKHELYIFFNENEMNGIFEKYLEKLKKIHHDKFIVFCQNIARFQGDKEKKNGKIKLDEISHDFLYDINIHDEEELLKNKMIELMK